MYYLIDLHEGKRRAFSTKESLAFAYQALDGSFENFNLNGKDCRNTQTIPATYELRQYQVLDKNGRSVDIRQWNDVFEVLRTCPNAYIYREGYRTPKDVCTAGFISKDRMHRCRLPKMQMQAKRNSVYWIEEFSDVPIIDRSKARDKISLCEWCDKVEAKLRNQFHKKSWKDQTKKAYQWAKHQRQRDSFPLQNEPERELNFDEILEKEGE